MPLRPGSTSSAALLNFIFTGLMGQPSVYHIYQRLLRAYGPQSWWPADSEFEIIIGAILTQNTSWVNVERAIINLKQARVLSAERIATIPLSQLARLLKPSGYFNLKARRLKNFCRWLLAQDGLQKLHNWHTPVLREALLEINGIGPETCDSILLYVFRRPVFVIDAYTRRLFNRLGMLEAKPDYETLRSWFERRLMRVRHKVPVFNEYHALIVAHAKQNCRSNPLCQTCCLLAACEHAAGG